MGEEAEIEKRLRRELRDLAYSVFVPREYADLVEMLRDVLKSVFSSDHVILETGLMPKEEARHRCKYINYDYREFEIVEALGDFYLRADIVTENKTYRVYAEFQAHFVTTPERSAHIVLYLKPPHELRVDVD